MLSKAEAKRLRALRLPSGRAGSGLFLAEGVRLVEELIASPIVLRLAVVATSLEDTERGARLARALRARVQILSAADHEIAGIADTDTPQGVLVSAEIPRRRLADVPLRDREVVVVLDAVQDPGNFGSIVRSADAFGAACVCVLPGTVDPWNPKAVRAAAGSSFRVPIIETEMTELGTFLRSGGFRLLGADMDGVPVEQLASHPRSALVLGNEGAGLGSTVLSELDGAVSVPIRGAAESLNVGVAAGILLYTLSRER